MYSGLFILSRKEVISCALWDACCCYNHDKLVPLTYIDFSIFFFLWTKQNKFCPTSYFMPQEVLENNVYLLLRFPKVSWFLDQCKENDCFCLFCLSFTLTTFHFPFIFSPSFFNKMKLGRVCRFQQQGLLVLYNFPEQFPQGNGMVCNICKAS